MTAAIRDEGAVIARVEPPLEMRHHCPASRHDGVGGTGCQIGRFGQQRHRLRGRHRSHHHVETPQIGSPLVFQSPFPAVRRHRRHPDATARLDHRRQCSGRRVHPRYSPRTARRVIPQAYHPGQAARSGRSTRPRPHRGPRHRPVAKALIARGEVLRAMVEPEVVGAPRRHPPARPAPLVEDRDGPSLTDQPFGADQPRQPAPMTATRGTTRRLGKSMIDGSFMPEVSDCGGELYSRTKHRPPQSIIQIKDQSYRAGDVAH